MVQDNGNQEYQEECIRIKYKTTTSTKTKLPRNQLNKNIKFHNKFGINIPKSTIESLMMYIIYNHNLWEDSTTKEMYVLDILGVCQKYPPKEKFEKKDVWEWSPTRMIFDIKQQYF